MTSTVNARNLRKRYKDTAALDGITMDIPEGRIVGLIGPNGAGKTTFLRALLGLIRIEGDLEVLGLDPRRARADLMQRTAFIADVATLPRWIRVRQLLEFLTATHPHFSADKAHRYLSDTKVKLRQRVRELSKGMIVQTHLAMVMAIDADLLILDEPTLGLDLLFRKTFYTHLLNDYFDGNRTIIVSTHQVEEVEHILTDVAFIREGQIALYGTMEEIAERYTQIEVTNENLAQARALNPLQEQTLLGRHLLLFDGRTHDELAHLGKIHQPRLADLFVAIMDNLNKREPA